MIAVIFVLLIAAAMAPWVLAYYLDRLPYAPECPHCGAVTADGWPRGWLDRACGRFTATAFRTCACCGWAGRMRWRLATQRVAGRH